MDKEMGTLQMHRSKLISANGSKSTKRSRFPVCLVYWRSGEKNFIQIFLRSAAKSSWCTSQKMWNLFSKVPSVSPRATGVVGAEEPHSSPPFRLSHWPRCASSHPLFALTLLINTWTDSCKVKYSFDAGSRQWAELIIEDYFRCYLLISLEK